MNKLPSLPTLLPPAVAEIGKIHFEGNVIPHQWFNYIKLPSGKSDLTAIIILSEIVYWYRPIQTLETEYDTQKVNLKRKFTHDKFNCTAAYFVNKFGLTVDQVRKALKRLEDDEYILREYRDIETRQGVRLTNIMFVEPVPSKIMDITHSYTVSDGTPSPQGDTPSPQGDTPSPQGDTPSPQGDTPSPQGYHTKITTKTSTETSTTTTVDSPGHKDLPADESSSGNLIYPKELLPEEQGEAARMLGAVDGQAQQLLDELAGQLRVKEIKNPLGYLYGLIAKAKEGKFSAVAGIKVGESRKRRSRTEVSLKGDEESASKPLEGLRRKERGRQLDELRKIRKSLGATSHLWSFRAG